MTTKTGSRRCVPKPVRQVAAHAAPIGVDQQSGLESGSYEPATYWTAAGRDPGHREHESRYVRTEVFERQEQSLMAALSGLEFGSILEVGCGWGRITRLVHERWPAVPYYAIDLSALRLESARAKVPGVKFSQTALDAFEPGSPAKWDLVLAVEMLMHVQPAGVGVAIDKLLGLSSRYVVTLDWTVPLGDRPIAPWNFLHDYPALYGSRLISVEAIGLQAIYVVEIGR